jgi:indole-3-glycerol phosphate synthase
MRAHAYARTHAHALGSDNQAMSDILEKIIRVKREEIAAAKQRMSLQAVREDAISRVIVRDFVGAMRARISAGQAAVIAEIKKASPSKGVIREDFDAADIAQSYALGNTAAVMKAEKSSKLSAAARAKIVSAACLSVLTDRQFFQGEPDFLKLARASCELPVLRKDFMIEPYQIYESRAFGADCILLIAACLDDAQMADLQACALSLDMAVLVEVHSKAELHRALKLKSVPTKTMLGINNRDLRTFDVSLNVTLSMLADVPPETLLITESGITCKDDVQKMRSAGVHAFLVGETFMRAEDPGLALAALFA